MEANQTCPENDVISCTRDVERFTQSLIVATEQLAGKSGTKQQVLQKRAL
jgi:hypothetical protein